MGAYSVERCCCCVAQACPTLCDPIDPSPPGSSVHGISRQEYWSGCQCLLQCLKVKSESEVAQACPTLPDPLGGSPPGAPVPGMALPSPSPTAQQQRCTNRCCLYDPHETLQHKLSKRGQIQKTTFQHYFIYINLRISLKKAGISWKG